MSNPEASRGYVVHSRAWYSKSQPLPDGRVDDIVLTDHGLGEMVIAWSGRVQREGRPTVVLELPDESWHLLRDWADVLAALAREAGRETPPTVGDVEQVLKQLGFVDETAVEVPPSMAALRDAGSRARGG